MERWKILTGLSAATGLSILLLVPTQDVLDLNKESSEPQQPALTVTDQPMEHDSPSSQRSSDQTTSKLSSQKLTSLKNASGGTINGLSDAENSKQERIQQYSLQFEKFFAQSHHLNRDEIRNEILDGLLRDPENISLASNTLTNLQYANEIFKDFQAQARVGAIELLRYAAKQGDTAPLKATLKDLGNVMNTQQAWEKGIQHDYVALIATYVNTIEVEDFLNYPDEHLATIGLTQKTSVEVQKGLIDSKLRAVEPSILKEKLGHYFQFGES